MPVSSLTSVAITIATFRRPTLLEQLLNSLSRLETPSVTIKVIVVDNDAAGSAREVCELSTLPVEYVIEEEPGISAARNRGLSLALANGSDAVVFIDDDEVATPEWLRSLVEVAERTGASVVSGPVIPHLPHDAPRWGRRIGWFARPCYSTGSTVRWPATNNALVRRSALETLGGSYFDASFSLTGGGDAELFWRLRRSGAKFVWSADAVVTELVPMSRITPRWIWRRGVRLGNVSGRLQLRQRSPLTVFFIGIARMGIGVLFSPLLLVGHGPGAATRLMHLPKGLGTVQSVFGRYVVEYARKK